MRIYCSNLLLYLISGTFFSIAWPVWRISFGHATVSLLSINILDQLTLVNLTRMGGCPRAPGSFPSHPCRLQTRFSHLQSHFFGSGFHFTDSLLDIGFCNPKSHKCWSPGTRSGYIFVIMMCILASFPLGLLLHLIVYTNHN